MSTANTMSQEVVVIDPSVSDYKTLIAGLSPDIPVVILPEGGDGLTNLAQALSGYENLSAVHLVSHGNRGQLQLGDHPVDGEALQSHPAELQQIAGTLAPGADLMLYGCSVANGEEGEAFLDQLAASLGDIDIAASDDRTGPLTLGGDWDLEYSEGEIETVLPFTVQGMQDIDHCLGCLNGSFTSLSVDDGSCGDNGRDPAPDPTPSNNAPVFVSATSFSVDENSANTTEVHNVEANNGDGGAADTGVTYSIISGNEDRDGDGNLAFAIDTNTGVITLNDTGDLDFEDSSKNSFTLSVQADDGQSSNNTKNQTITVSVTDSGVGGTFDFEAFNSGNASFDASGQTFTISGMAGQSVGNYGSNPVGQNGNSDGYMDASGTGVVGGLVAPDGTTFRALMFDVWPSASNGGTVTADGQSITVIGKLDGQQVLSETVTTFSFGQSPEAQGGPWQRIDLTGTDFLTTDIDEIEFSIASPLNYLAVDNFVYDNLLTTPNQVPTLTSVDNVTSASEDTAKEISFSDLQGLADDLDGDGTVDGFVVKAVSSGTLKIGADAASATAWAETSNDVIDASNKAFWTPAADANGNLNAFTVVALDDDGGQSASPVQVVIETAAVNDAPTLSNLNGDSVSFSIGGNAISLDASSNLSLTDIDSSDFDGGSISVALTNGVDAEDVLLVGNVGNISLSGTTINHSDNGGVSIGTLSGGSNGVDLSITLNSSATVARVQDLLGALQYQDTDSSTSNTTDRNVSITVSDGDSGTSAAQTVTISLVRAPIIDLDGDDSSTATDGNFSAVFTEGGAVTLADTDSTISDDGTFKSLTVTLNNRPDTVAESLASTIGTGAQVVNGEAVTIGAYNSNDGTLAITVDDGSADADTLQQLMESIQYNNTADDPDSTDRNISFTAVDNDDNTSAAATTTLSVIGVNDQPTLTATGATPTFTEDSGNNAQLFSNASLDTIESGQTVQQLVLTVSNVTDGDISTGDQEFLVIDSTDVALNNSNTATTAGGHSVLVSLDNAGTATVTLTGSNLSVSDAESLINALAYKNSSDAPTTTSTRVVSITGVQDSGGTANSGVDADNNLSNISATVTLQDANDAPTASDTTESVAYNGSYTFTTDDFGFDDPDTGDTIQNIHIVSLPDKGSLTLGGNEVSLNLDVDPAYISASDIANNQLVYTPETGGTGDGYSSFTFTVGDGNSESAVPNTVTLDVAAPPAPPARPAPTTPPATVKETVDGVDVEKQTTTDSEGNTSTTITIDPTTDSRQEDNSTGNSDKADIPLFQEDDGNSALSVALPTGVGVTAEGSGEAGTAGDSLADLIRLIDETADDSAEAANKDEMLSGGESFLQTLQDENLWVNKLTLSTADNTAPDTPIVISGNTRTITSEGVDNSKAALVIDATSLPADTVLQLDDVEFAVIVGPATLTGGEGQNTIFAGAGSQTIVLGADDDQLYVGDGDDTVGSKGGDDLIFGENGNDTLFGGEGQDQLHGGRDTDVVTFDGNRDQYEVTQQNGVVTVTSKADGTDVDTLINVEQIQFADQTATVEYQSDLQGIATLYQQVLGRQADLGGFQYTAAAQDSGQTLGQSAVNMLNTAEFTQTASVQFDQLSGEEQIEAFYTHLLGRESDAEGKAFWLSELNGGASLAQIAEGFVQSTEMQQQYLAAENWDFFV